MKGGGGGCVEGSIFQSLPTRTTSIHSRAPAPSASMMPGGEPVFSTTEQERRLLAFVMARIFFRDVMWWVLMRMRWMVGILGRHCLGWVDG